MKSNSNRLSLLKDENVSKSLLKLGIPTMIGLMTSALYNLVDAFFVGQLGKSQMAAVSVVYPLGIIILGIGLLFGSGAASSLSRLIGNKQYHEANQYASTALFTGLGIGTCLIVLMMLFIDPLLQILGATETIIPYAKSYGILFIVGLLLNIFNITVNNIITSEGAASVSMTAQLSGGLLNMVLDPIFIFLVGMGVEGAAIATLLSRCVTTGIYAYYILSGKSIYKISSKNFSPSFPLYIEIIKIGIPMLLFQLLTSISLSLTNALASDYGDAAIASLGLVTRIISLGSMAIMGFMKGFQPFIGYNYGANNIGRVKLATRTALIWSTGFCLISSVFLIAFSHQIVASFSNDDAEVIAIGSNVLLINSVTFIGFGFQAVYSSLFLALGKAKEGALISIGRQGAFFIPLIFIVNSWFGLNGIIIAQPLADALSILLVTFLALKMRFVSDPSKRISVNC